MKRTPFNCKVNSAATMRAYCETPGDIRDSILRKKGLRRCFRVPVMAIRGATESGTPQVGEAVYPVVSPYQSEQLC